MKTLFICLFQLVFFTLTAQVILPTPTVRENNNDLFIITGNNLKVFTPDHSASYLELLKSEVLNLSIHVIYSNDPEKSDISFLVDSSLGRDAYKLNISSKGIVIRAASSGGFIYAVQTLRQLAQSENGALKFAGVCISDNPRIQWRSFMLDSGRQYQKVETIKKYIDMASLLKMNYFHWHLTEGLGWRIEIKKYPKLTETGAFVGKGEEQQGFYTQDQVREIVTYAMKRNITVVPEIDMPGHAEAALVSYPELGCFGEKVVVPERGFTKHIFCVGKPNTIAVLKDIMDEVCNLFPSEFIHLGGDEAPKGNWDVCKDCQQTINNEGLRNSHDLQLWFSAQMANYLKLKGRKAIFWGDVVYQQGYPLPDNTVIHWWNWRGHKDLAFRNAIKQDYPVICGTNYYTYLNFTVTPWKGYGPERTSDLKDVYVDNPSHKVNYKDPLVLGMSCALWTDDGVTERLINRRLFPRILALSEQMWHDGQLADFNSFKNAVDRKKEWFEKQGFDFGPALREETSDSYKWD